MTHAMMGYIFHPYVNIYNIRASILFLTEIRNCSCDFTGQSLRVLQSNCITNLLLKTVETIFRTTFSHCRQIEVLKELICN